MKPYVLREPKRHGKGVIYGWRLTSDGNDTFVLQRGSFKTSKGKYTDEVAWDHTTQTYYPTLTGALRASISRLVASGDHKLPQEVADALYAVSRALREISEEVEGRPIRLEVTL
jgi:hypothetical protein